ncbi:unnamed protein product [Microthlaspi erraticum]|uniref:Uncharacterized protein n=1 Tax=Microthlaspi erraticum TaxID=1685480 RepID=A0A6D2L6C0_9BRAS|nr:unnamed protein product [Microthlaspi erraticum]
MNDLIRDSYYWRRARVPQEDEVVMVRLMDSAVDHRDSVRVRLEEYGRQMGTLTFSDGQRDQILAGRTIPAVVIQLDFNRVLRILQNHIRRIPRFRRITRFRRIPGRIPRFHRIAGGIPRVRRMRSRRIWLGLSPLSQEQILNCDREYTENLYVNSVLRHLAVARQNLVHQMASLEELYELTRWPRYQDISSGLSPYWPSLPRPLRDMFRHSCEQVYIDSWRITDNSLFSPPLLHEGYYCFAIALIWQFEAFLKLHHLLPRHQFLSIQDFIDNIPADRVVAGEGIAHLDHAFSTLRHGVLLAHDGPELTFVRGEPVPRNGLTVYSTDELGIDLSLRTYSVGNELEDELRHEVRLFGAVSASIYWYASYSVQALDPQAILRPTPQDLEEFGDVVHTVLVKGSGKDLNGIKYWEVQDSFGDTILGDRGHFRLYRGLYPILILDYVTMRRP